MARRVAGPRKLSLAGGQDRGPAHGERRKVTEGWEKGCKDAEKGRWEGAQNCTLSTHFLNYFC